MNEITISQHALERYAERIMDRDNKTDIAVFLRDHKEKAETDIKKMIEFGEWLYTGISTTNYNKAIVDVYLNGTWVLILDNKSKKVITLYAIDLGLGKEFNEAYIQKLKEKLNIYREGQKEFTEYTESTVQELQQKVNENIRLIAEYKHYIKTLEKTNESFNESIKALRDEYEVSERGIKEVVATFVGRKVF